MKIKLLSLVIVWFITNTVFAQKEFNTWYFGQNAGLDFSSGAPVALTNGQVNTIEGCSTISDANGNLLFYTDGITVWDRNHNQMPNGTGLAGNSSSTQSALIVAFPGNNSMYYIFTTGGWFLIPDFNYSVVDMTLNGGNGAVTLKNQFLVTPVTERLTAVRHANNTDIWVVVQGLSNINLYAYLVTAAGVASTPVISTVGANIAGLDAQGYMKFSPDGSKIAYVTSLLSYVDLFDFNSTTGIVSNKKHLPLPPITGIRSYGLEFSQSGNYLYCGTQLSPKAIYQWDVTSNSEAIINATIDSIATTSSQEIDALQMGPNGKIYVAKYGASYLGVINNPEMPGLLCNYVDTGVYLGGMLSAAGLPDFITSYFLPTGINANNSLQSKVTIYPNPIPDKICISFPAIASENITVKIFSITGEIVFTEENKIVSNYFSKKIDVNGFSNGIYFLSLQTEKDLITKKIVVQH